MFVMLLVLVGVEEGMSFLVCTRLIDVVGWGTTGNGEKPEGYSEVCE